MHPGGFHGTKLQVGSYKPRSLLTPALAGASCPRQFPQSHVASSTPGFQWAPTNLRLCPTWALADFIGPRQHPQHQVAPGRFPQTQAFSLPQLQPSLVAWAAPEDLSSWQTSENLGSWPTPMLTDSHCTRLLAHPSTSWFMQPCWLLWLQAPNQPP